MACAVQRLRFPAKRRQMEPSNDLTHSVPAGSYFAAQKSGGLALRRFSC